MTDTFLHPTSDGQEKIVHATPTGMCWARWPSPSADLHLAPVPQGDGEEEQQQTLGSFFDVWK